MVEGTLVRTSATLRRNGHRLRHSFRKEVASLLKARGLSPDMDAARKAGPHVERGFQAFADAWRESEIARRK